MGLARLTLGVEQYRALPAQFDRLSQVSTDAVGTHRLDFDPSGLRARTWNEQRAQKEPAIRHRGDCSVDRQRRAPQRWQPRVGNSNQKIYTHRRPECSHVQQAGAPGQGKDRGAAKTDRGVSKATVRRFGGSDRIRIGSDVPHAQTWRHRLASSSGNSRPTPRLRAHHAGELEEREKVATHRGQPGGLGILRKAISSPRRIFQSEAAASVAEFRAEPAGCSATHDPSALGLRR